MTGDDFLRIVSEAFTPFLAKLGFVMDEPSISGRFYRASFTGPAHIVSVSYEPGDDADFVLVERKGGTWPDLDDRVKTPRLADLNRLYAEAVTKEERAENDTVFESVVTHDDDERRILKDAKELRLVLPRYLASQG